MDLLRKGVGMAMAMAMGMGMGMAMAMAMGVGVGVGMATGKRRSEGMLCRMLGMYRWAMVGFDDDELGYEKRSRWTLSYG